MIKKGLLGGSFDPVHQGHLNMALSALDTFDLDLVWLQPNKIPYYKKQAAVSDEERLKMLEIAVCGLGDSRIRVSDLEIREKDYLSTAEVLKRLRTEDPECALVFIMGMDSWLYFHKWRNYETILENANIAVFNRPGHVFNPEEQPEELKILYRRHLVKDPGTMNRNGGLYFVESRPYDISSTELRTMLGKRDEDAAGYVPEEVLKYIKNRGLYLDNV